jgi:retinol dehydrogenase 12
VALIAFTKQLASEYPQLKIAAIHPGRISTGMGRALARDSRLIRWGGILGKFTTTTIELGVLNHLYGAVSPDVQSGEYYVPVGIIDKKTIVEKEKTLVTRLKEWTDEELKGRY